MSAYIEISERSQINSLMMHLMLLAEQEQVKSQISRWKEIIKSVAEINPMYTNKSTKNH
jgi:hypothetical protein